MVIKINDIVFVHNGKNVLLGNGIGKNRILNGISLIEITELLSHYGIMNSIIFSRPKRMEDILYLEDRLSEEQE